MGGKYSNSLMVEAGPGSIVLSVQFSLLCCVFENADDKMLGGKYSNASWLQGHHLRTHKPFLS